MDRRRLLARLRAGLRAGNLVLAGALLGYAISVAAAGFLGRIAVPRLDAVESLPVRVLLGLVVWDAGKALGVALGAVALARLADLGPRGGGIALTATTYALDLGVALLLSQARGPWTRPEALLGRAAIAVLVGWMAVAILRRLGPRWGGRLRAAARPTSPAKPVAPAKPAAPAEPTPAEPGSVPRQAP
ncbi:MAG TPA: hypothetical protein VGQ83_42550 [Polyangia bacterium]|jgi:hypothetical protein